MNKNDYIIRAMAKLNWPHLPIRQAKLLETEGTWIILQHKSLYMDRWTTKEEEFTLQKYGYQSKKRRVTVYLVWSNHGSPILFYHGLDIELIM